jgi:hypothetical protein
MFHPCRGGVRGGKDQFTWESVKTDKDRECYLGHSVMAPVGRWQQGKDIHWYNAEDKAKQAKVINEEFLKAKELEEKALMAALGYKVVEKPKQNNELEQMKIKQEYEEKSKSKKHDDKDNEAKVKIKKEKQGPQIVDFDSTHELDGMLLKLVAKYGFDKVFDALADEDKSSKKHKKKHKKHHKSSKKSKRTHESSDSESESGDKKRKKSKHKSSKKSSSKDNSSSQSSSSSSDSD